jgi:hypothetical protein
MTILLAVFQIVLGFALLKFIPNAKTDGEPSPTFGAIIGFFALVCFTTAYYLITN